MRLEDFPYFAVRRPEPRLLQNLQMEFMIKALEAAGFCVMGKVLAHLKPDFVTDLGPNGSEHRFYALSEPAQLWLLLNPEGPRRTHPF